MPTPGLLKRQPVFSGSYEELKIDYQPDSRTLWAWMLASHFSLDLLGEARHVQNHILDAKKEDMAFVVLGSMCPGVFNLGGDLALFQKLIRERDKKALATYASKCVDVCYLNAISYDRAITTISLVQGDALGGGFEAALSATLMVAERQAQFGFPEVMFNLFPGMGALTLLKRRIGLSAAAELLHSGKLYSAEVLHELGIVDVLVDEGDGVATVKEIIKSRKRTLLGHGAIDCAQRLCQPIDRKELASIADLWVDTALKVTEKDLKLMARLASRQKREY